VTGAAPVVSAGVVAAGFGFGFGGAVLGFGFGAGCGADRVTTARVERRTTTCRACTTGRARALCRRTDLAGGAFAFGTTATGPSFEGFATTGFGAASVLAFSARGSNAARQR
jgi:hypothetical protein